MLNKEILEVIKNAISLITVDYGYDKHYNLDCTLDTTRAIEYIDSKIKEIDENIKEMAKFLGNKFKSTKE